MKRRRVVVGGSIAGAFLALAVVRLLFGNGLIWHVLPWHVGL